MVLPARPEMVALPRGPPAVDSTWFARQRADARNRGENEASPTPGTAPPEVHPSSQPRNPRHSHEPPPSYRTGSTAPSFKTVSDESYNSIRSNTQSSRPRSRARHTELARTVESGRRHASGTPAEATRASAAGNDLESGNVRTASSLSEEEEDLKCKKWYCWLMLVALVIVIVLGFAGPRYFYHGSSSGSASASEAPKVVSDTFTCGNNTTAPSCNLEIKSYSNVTRDNINEWLNKHCVWWIDEWRCDSTEDDGVHSDYPTVTIKHMAFPGANETAHETFYLKDAPLANSSQAQPNSTRHEAEGLWEGPG